MGARRTQRTRAELAEIGRKARKDYERGMSVREIAEAAGRDEALTYRMLIRAGTTMRPGGGSMIHKYGASTRHDEQFARYVARHLPPGREVTKALLGSCVRSDYEGGRTIAQIADDMGRSRQGVRALLIDAGATIRGRGKDQAPRLRTRWDG